MATCDVEQLMSDGRCFTCLEPKQMQAVLLQLLCELQENVTEVASAATALPTVEDLAYAASIDIDLDGADYQRITLAGDLDLNGTLNRPGIGFAKAVALRILDDSGGRNLTFNASWVPIGTVPASITAGKVAIVSISCLGPDETDVLYAYQEEP